MAKGVGGGTFVGVQVQTQAPCGTDPAPSSEKDRTAEQIMLDAHLVKSPCVPRCVDARHTGLQGKKRDLFHAMLFMRLTP